MMISIVEVISRIDSFSSNRRWYMSTRMVSIIIIWAQSWSTTKSFSISLRSTRKAYRRCLKQQWVSPLQPCKKSTSLTSQWIHFPPWFRTSQLTPFWASTTTTMTRILLSTRCRSIAVTFKTYPRSESFSNQDDQVHLTVIPPRTKQLALKSVNKHRFHLNKASVQLY